MKTILLTVLAVLISGCTTSKTSVLPYKNTKAKSDEWVLIKVEF